jgi:hypothetical protein
LLIPSLTSKGALFFRNFSQLNAIPFGRGTPEPFAPEYDGQCVGLDAEMMAWESNKMKLVPRTLRNAVMGMATLALRENAVVLEFNPPEHSEELGFTSITFNRFDSFSKRPTTITFGAGFEGILAAVTSERVLNKRHAITTYLLSKQETSLDEPEFSFLHCLACAMTEKGSLEALASGHFANTRFNEAFSSLGYFFKNVDLCTLRTEHRPPYKCWLADRGIFEITEATLAQLAEIQMIDWSRHKEPRHL